ncbi:MAG: hypothetical protein ACXWDK_09040 [Aeromicrobium sp.]
MLLAACGSGAEKVAAKGSSETSSAPEWKREYRSPGDIIEKLRAGGVDCEPDGDPGATAYSLRKEDCTVPGGDGTEFYSVDVYGSSEQQDEAQTYLVDANPGVAFVWGTGWSISIPFESDGSTVVDIVGGDLSEG